MGKMRSVKTILFKENYLLIPSTGYFQVRDGKVLPLQGVDPYSCNKVGITGCKIITFKE